VKRLILLIAILLCPLAVSAQTTVSGTLVDTGLTTVTSNNIYVRFTLQNYTSQPRVVSTGILVKVSRDCTQAQITATTCKVTANASITPANTYWQACFFNDVARVGCLDYTVTGSFNLNTATPISTPPSATSLNCSSSASPAVCASAAAGSVALPVGGTTLTVNTTAVTANSQILVTEDSSLGTKLSITCNTTTGRTYTVTARTASTSFVITSTAAPVTNGACLSYLVVN
jgi:hypothetical protein